MRKYNSQVITSYQDKMSSHSTKNSPYFVSFNSHKTPTRRYYFTDKEIGAQRA